METNPEDLEKQDIKARKEAKRVQKLFREVFKNDEAQECLQIISNLHNLHLPSMPAVDFDPLPAAYMDGQKSILQEIEDIQKGKYNE